MMETIRDMVVIVFSVTGTVTSAALLFMALKLYPRISSSLEQVGRASEDIHVAAQGARSGVRLAKGALAVVAPALPGSSWVRTTYRVVAIIPRSLRFVSRSKKPSALTPGE